MNPIKKEKTDKLYTALKEALKDTAIEVRPFSPVKYERGESSDIMLKYPDKHPILGIEVQMRAGDYKMWFCDHREWELITKYPVKQWALNGTGPGSGDGFYVDTQEECINEAMAFLEYYYPSIFNQGKHS